MSPFERPEATSAENLALAGRQSSRSPRTAVRPAHAHSRAARRPRPRRSGRPGAEASRRSPAAGSGEWRAAAARAARDASRARPSSRGKPSRVNTATASSSSATARLRGNELGLAGVRPPRRVLARPGSPRASAQRRHRSRRLLELSRTRLHRRHAARGRVPSSSAAAPDESSRARAIIASPRRVCSSASAGERLPVMLHPLEQPNRLLVPSLPHPQFGQHRQRQRSSARPARVLVQAQRLREDVSARPQSPARTSTAP